MRTIHTDNLKIKLKNAKGLGTDEFGNVIEVEISTSDNNNFTERLEKLEKTVEKLKTIIDKDDSKEETPIDNTTTHTKGCDPSYHKYFPKSTEELKDYIHQLIEEQGQNADLNVICTSEIKDMYRLFSHISLKSFNGDISKWDTSNVINMSGMFDTSHFNGDISKWDTSNVTDMSGMFANSKFNGNISKWNTSNVIDMNGMFTNSKFNRDIPNWDTSSVTNMSRMFETTDFNGDISKWNTSRVKNMSLMFGSCSFNGNISEWNVSNVTNMSGMFSMSKFNGDISKWDTSNVTDMSGMFYDAKSFNQDISNWNVSSVSEDTDVFEFCLIQEEYKPKFRK